LIDKDIKSPVLKSIQGRIWRRGYEDGTLRGELFPGVAAELSRLRDLGKQIAIYSSGSVEAQKLLLGHSSDGDLTGLVAEWFDTGVGPKGEPSSYRTIATRLGLDPPAILFATDHAGEATAAMAAGMTVALSLRGVTTPDDAKGIVPAPALIAEDIAKAITTALATP
jgi:enolase-phosphatase E1